MSKEFRILTTIKRKEGNFGYSTIGQFTQDFHAQGGITYSLSVYEEWEDGHITYSMTNEFRTYTTFKSKEEGNAEYKRMIKNGFKFVSKRSFDPSVNMDMR